MKEYKRYLLVEVSIHAENVEDAQVCYNNMERKITGVNVLAPNKKGSDGLVADAIRMPIKILEVILFQTAHRLPRTMRKWIKGKVL